MGGGPEYVLPSKAGRIIGGENPRHWKRNTILYIVFGIPALSYLVFRKSAELERRPISPAKPIPSQRWSKHALADDPDYHKKLEELERLNKEKPRWTRLLGDGHK